VILSPSFTFGVALATLYGALAHLILGGNGRRLLFFIVASWIGFAIGQGAGQVLQIRVLAIGPTSIIPATFGSIIALVAAVFLSARGDYEER
jgi:uncharacterized membrane protein YeaQ/YmgE (transglycosylase-associated protein family)